ncbi:cysteine dioxygenase [Gimesia maris]|uniref:Cysteine dioxygenase n=1 Tax=Gimesia maris TaxID=122 RepID=A0ABX5YN13_9PLAN|nr:cysteine dioxygenase family protein [Gimesia maris]EDL59363.1 hypothetical protein PM8797T_29483 [Gimesia maris DSM 8797]QEG17076.1 Cysteine dioxygenase [Gimesia maris]QGQ29812.1 hypothetical protein F1729_14755 [Gimesia maris]
MEPVRTDTIATVDELRSVLKTFSEPLKPWALLELVSQIQLTPSEWHKYLSFDPHRFCFRTIYGSANFEINIIGWRRGQFSSVHDHRGTSCCVRVLEGVLTNVDYHVGVSQELKQIRRVDLQAGEILSRNEWEIHRCGHEQSFRGDLATLHVYSPPLRPLSERQYDE